MGPVGMGWGGSCRGGWDGVSHVRQGGWGGSCRGGSGSCMGVMGGVCHALVGLVM